VAGAAVRRVQQRAILGLFSPVYVHRG